MLLSQVLPLLLIATSEPRAHAPRAEFIITDPPGLYPYKTFALHLRMSNVGSTKFKVCLENGFGPLLDWSMTDDQAKSVYMQKFNADYALIDPINFATLSPGHHFDSSVPWAWQMKDATTVQDVNWQFTYEVWLDLLYGSPPDFKDYLKGPIKSNTVKLRLGPGYVRILPNPKDPRRRREK